MRIEQAKTITGKIVETKRAGTSTMGNPTYYVWIDIELLDGIEAVSSFPVKLRTKSNAGLAYEITNPNYRVESHTFHLSRAGRVAWAEKVSA